MTDLLTRLADARPTDTEIDAMWSSDERGERFRSVLTTVTRRRPARRTATVAAVAGLAAAGLLPSVLSSGDAAAADLHALAHSAAAYTATTPAPGGWLHVKYHSSQHDAPMMGHPAASYDDDVESWTSFDGRTYRIDRRPSKGWVEYDVFHAKGPVGYQRPTPAYAATLPDDADGLLAYLDPRVSGSSSHAEAMFGALLDLAGSGVLPPRTLAATFDALARVDHVTTTDVVVAGRPAVEVSYAEASTSSIQSAVFDRATGQQLSEREGSLQSLYTDTTTLSEAVDDVPAEVLAAFRAHGDGVRYDAAGDPGDG